MDEIFTQDATMSMPDTHSGVFTNRIGIAVLYASLFQEPQAMIVGPILRDDPNFWICYARQPVTGDPLAWEFETFNCIFVAQVRLRSGRIAEFIDHRRHSRSWLPAVRTATAQRPTGSVALPAGQAKESLIGHGPDDTRHGASTGPNESAPKPGDPGFGDYVRAKYGRPLRFGDPEYAAANELFHQEAEQIVDNMHRENRRTGFFDVCKLAWQSIWHMGMYSSDPQISRMATIHYAQEQIQLQREITVRQRLEDQAREEERMRILGRAVADEMMARVDEARTDRPRSHE